MARYDKLRKLQRNVQLIQYRQQNPDLSLAEIGAVFGITGGRVWQIVNTPYKRGKQ